MSIGDGGFTQEIYGFHWEILLSHLISVLEKMKISYGEVEYGPRTKTDGTYYFKDSENYLGFKYSDLKINFLAREDSRFSKHKMVIISIYHNNANKSLLRIDKFSRAEYGYQVLLENPGFERFEQKIFDQLNNTIMKS